MELTVLSKVPRFKGLAAPITMPSKGADGKQMLFKKLQLTMKLTAVIMLAITLQISAKSVAQQVNIHASGITLPKVFSLLKQQTGYSFLCDQQLLQNVGPLKLQLRNVSLKEALDACFTGCSLTYVIHEKEQVVFIRRKPLPEVTVADQDIPVRGKVTDDASQPIPGVTIIVKRTKQVFFTNDKGEFAFKAAKSDVLEFTHMGFKSVEVTISQQQEITVQLLTASKDLTDVVVVGYSTQKKVNLTGAVTAIKGAALESRAVVNATQSLQGAVPGLNVSVGGNTKPGQSFNMNIRGVGNLSNSDKPYVLVDGMAMSLSDVNPSDIESISILKDAAASAIYGARAPYGVILVTTKQGKAEKTTLSYSNNFGATSPVKLPQMVNSYQFAQYFNASTFNAMGIRQYSDDKLKMLQDYINDPTNKSIFPEVTDNFYSNWENSANGVANTDWFRFHYKPYSLRQSHNLSASGGNKATQFYVSGGYYDDNGMMRYADINYKRFNFNANVTSQLTSWAKLKANTKFVQSRYRAPFNGTFESLFFHNLARMRPNVSVYDLNGNFTEMSAVPYLRSGSKDEVNGYNAALLTGLELQPVKNWKIFVDLNIMRDNTEEEVLKLPGVIYGIDGTPKYVNRSELAIPILGSYSRSTDANMYISPNIYTSYSYTLQNKHFFDVMLGFQQEKNTYNSMTGAAQDLISSTRPGLSLSTGSQTVAESRTHWATRGFFGRLNYNYKGKYLAEINGRYDGSSRFAAQNRWGFFPSLSLGYNIAEEPFMISLKEQISMLKLRASYGFLGNQSGAGLYSFTQVMNVTVPQPGGTGTRWYFQNGREAYIAAPDPFNQLVTWEKVENGNLGLDFLLLNDHLSGSFDIYRRTTRDMLGPSLDIADMYGGTPPSSNNASLRTNGWELSLSWKGRITRDITYSVGGLVSDYHSVVTSYQNPTRNDPAGSWYEGKQIGEIWGYRTGGLIQTADEATAFNKLNHSYLSAVAWMPGDVKYLDLNGDGKIDRGSNRLGDMGDMTIVGNTTPHYAYSFSGSIQWKGWGFNMMWQGIGKMNYAPKAGDAYFWGSGALAQVTVFKQHLNYWTPDNPGAYYPNPYAAPAGTINSFTAKTQQVADRYMQSAAYLRLKNIVLSYTLPQVWVDRVHMKKCNIFISGENLLTITKLAGMLDPETIVGGVDPGKLYPLSKVYAVGINISM
ncbi:TonB-linked SusC/RagA family outer membrane protein [Chitinophaga polysaccharea]|uniref:TonB-linked SusC/RagA family outer membrane protein n=1 Tax=Chitinophaga polysaccharea TaxID=1293035 RepID=A0A561PGU3_9BACT|nr:TonB-dependent receptor [Chitinophaga polysaccharea]TWF37338.1 TonB-linked SusC/RagA family outer membrane protein [Chitinophaga polysaccharea]